MNIPAIVVADIRGEGGEQPGAIEFRSLPGQDRVRGIAFRCPCGCGERSYLPVAVAGEETGRDAWTWNGSREHPSTTPSILQSGLPCKWHGYLTDGEFRPC